MGHVSLSGVDIARKEWLDTFALPATGQISLARLKCGGRIRDAFELQGYVYSRKDAAWRSLYCFVVDWEDCFVTDPRNFRTEFVAMRLNSEQKEAFLDWTTNALPDLGDLLQDTIAEGYKISLNWDKSNDTFICAISGNENHPVNASLCLTARAEGVLEALLLGLFKHTVISRGVPWRSVSDDNRKWG